ncbi:MAG: hypothetical protein WC378_18495 [Opitutaceae bacterium]|jgi:hypothetical protein
MEADLRFLIAGLAFKGEDIVASVFMDGLHLSGNLNILRKLAREYLGDEKRFAEIVDLAEKIQKKRNLFIHGLWSPGNFGEENGFATVRDLRTKTEKQGNGRLWTRGQSEQFSVDDFQTILNEVNLISDKIAKLCAWLEKHEDIEFGSFGVTSKGEPMMFAINSDGSLTPVKKK